jgi:peroxiredoxin
MKRLLAIFIVFLAGAGVPQAGEKLTAMVKDFGLRDAKGTKHTAAAWQGKAAVVLVFLGTECPVSNGYSAEYRRLVTAYAGKGVLFYGVHPDPEVTAAIAAKHAAEFRLPFPVLLDPTQGVAKQAGVTVVPEAVVLSPKGQVLYRGRIDDLYTPEGNRREEPKTRDLEAALRAVLAGMTPPVPQTKAFGCPLPQPIK